MSCTVAANWDNTKLYLKSGDGTETYKQNVDYEITHGDTNVLVKLSNKLKGENLVLISNIGFGKANNGKDQSPSKELNFKYEING